MIRWIVFLGFCAATFFIVGCGDGIAISQRERMARHEKIFELEMLQISDDWDLIWLNDRLPRLSPHRLR